jgi:hypothetical protein
MMKFTHLLFVPLTLAATIAAAGCDSADSGDDGGDNGTGGTGSGTGGTGNTSNGMNTELQPSDVGWMDAEDVWNDMEIQGAWYPYGDAYGAAKCTGVGEHPATDCSIITRPDPAVEEFRQPEAPGRMCTAGEVAAVLACDDDLLTRCPHCSGCPASDYSTMWGAGIGFDLNSEGGSATAPKFPWNPDDHGVIGFSFEFVGTDGTPLAVPLGGIRVEIPMQLTAADTANLTPPIPGEITTDDHPDGAPYWGATSSYPASPLSSGKNCVTWSMISAPGMKRYMFDKTRMLGVQFHVPTDATGRRMYNFCIQKFTMLRELPTDCANTVTM